MPAAPHRLTPVEADTELGRLLHIRVHDFSFNFINFATGTKGERTQREIELGELEITLSA